MAVVQVTWVSLLLLGGWLAAAYVARRQYVENLQDSIHQYRLDTERASATGLDRQATDLLATKLGGEDPSEVLYALRLLGAGTHRTTHPAVRGLLKHPSPEVRAEAIRLLDESGDAARTPGREAAARSRPGRAHPGAAVSSRITRRSIRWIASRSSASSTTSRSAPRW